MFSMTEVVVGEDKQVSHGVLLPGFLGTCLDGPFLHSHFISRTIKLLP